MSDSEKLAFMARAELSLTTKAFDELRKRLMDELLSATTPEDAYHGVIAVRSIDSVLKSFDAIIETPIIEKTVRENEDG